MKISHRMDAFKIDWKKFRYMVFDIPNHTGNYAERYAALGILVIYIIYLLVLTLSFLCIHSY